MCTRGSGGHKEKLTVKKLYVGNLSFKATEEEVAALFAESGVQPDSLTLLRDRFTGQPRGFGFAEIRDDAEAEKAIAALNGREFMGRALVVNEARPQRDGGGGGGGGGGRGRARWPRRRRWWWRPRRARWVRPRSRPVVNRALVTVGDCAGRRTLNIPSRLVDINVC